MKAPQAFVIKLLGTKFEIVPYWTRGIGSRLRYRVVCRHFAPPSSTDFIANPNDLRALRDWLDTVLANHPLGTEVYQDGQQVNR